MGIPKKILMLHNRYLIRGGEDESFDSESALLESRGHEVIRYLQDNHRIGEMSSWKVGFRAVWSWEDYHSIRQLIREQRPDVLHVQNFFPLISPAAYYAARAEGVPVIQTLRNYRLWCLNAYFFRDKHPCENCFGKFIPWPGIVHACYRESPAASAAVATMLATHRLMGTWIDRVDRYIALTEFARNKFIEGGLPADKIIVKPNFVYPDPGLGTKRDNFLLFVGRLSEEKGLPILLKAWKVLGRSILLKIVGDGPLKDYIETASAPIAGVEYLGRQPMEVVYQLMGRAKALVFPSQCYEGLPRTIIESFAKGTPVIASNLGSMTTLIEHRRTGLHFTPGSSEQLVQQVKWMLNNLDIWDKMRQEARAEFETKYSANRSYEMLLDIYQQAIKKFSNKND